MANINDNNDYTEIPERASSREGIMNAMDQLIPDPSRPMKAPEPEQSIESEPINNDVSESNELQSEDPIHSQAPKEEKVELPKTPTKTNKVGNTKPTELPKSQAATPSTLPTAQAPTEPERPFDEEIDAIKAPPGVNPQALKQLRSIAAKYKGEANQLRPQLTQLQSQIAALSQQTEKLPEQVEHELKELRAHRTLYDIQNDPSFKAAYDDKIDLTSNQLYDHLRSLPTPLPESDIEALKKGGGIFNYRDKNGDLIIDTQWWKENVTEKMLFSHVAKYEQLMKSGLMLKDAKEQTIQNVKQNREQFENDRTQYVQKMKQEEGQTAQKIISTFQQQIPWTRVQDIPVDATPELRSAIEQDNAFLPQLEKHFEEAYKAFDERNVQKRTEIAATYALAHKQAQMLSNGQKTLQQIQAREGEKDAEINRLNGEIQKMRNAGKTKPSTPTVTTSSGKPKSAPEDEYMGMSTKQALAARLG